MGDESWTGALGRGGELGTSGRSVSGDSGEDDIMIGSGSGGSGVVLTRTFDGLFAFDLEAPRELGIGVGSPALEDRRSLRVLRGSGDSIEARRAPSFSSASGVFRDDTALSSGDSFLSIPSDSGVKRFLVLRATLTARCVGGFDGPARFPSSSESVPSLC